MFSRFVRALCIGPIFLCIALMGAPAQADVTEIGDLNVIDDSGNPSDGLRYLDMSFSNGLTFPAALTNAQASYPNARLATPGEFDDLLAAARISYDGALTASDGFSVGPTMVISSGANFDGGVLAAALGFTQASFTVIWTDPDGSAGATTRDFFALIPTSASVQQELSVPPSAGFGWLLVSEATTRVSVDIKPGSDPNCFNINGHGVVPVAILGSDTFDVGEIDFDTLLFGGLAVRVRGNKGPLCSFEYSNGDSFLDLVCHFEDDASSWVTGNGTATLTGQLFDGTLIEGSDSICVVP